MYNTREFLNPIGHSSTGYIICFDGEVIENEDVFNETYIKFGDCKTGVTFHKWAVEPDCEERFLTKLKLMSNEINNFIIYLENKKK